MVREESHLDDMRAAIRGDFERLAERRGSQELMREDVVDESAAIPERAAEPEAPSPPGPRPEPEAEPIAEAPEAELVEAPPEAELVEAPPEAEPEPADSHVAQPADVTQEDATPGDAAPEDAEPEDGAQRKSWLARVLGL